jgi:hypothetical protein
MNSHDGAADAGSRQQDAGADDLVSVIIPFLDPPEGFLREAIESVLGQDYRPLELILVNDGSAPATVRMARGLLEALTIPARCIEHPGGINRGCSATRNLGARTARGRYLAFLDADDAWMPGKLTEQVEILRQDADLALVFGPSMYWYSWNRAGGDAREDVILDRGVERPRRMPPPEFVALFLRGRIVNPSPTNFMVRRDAYHACGGFEESFRGMYEDQAFLVKVGLGHAVCAVPNCWDRYRQHPQSMTAQADAAGAEEDARRAFLGWVRQYCASHGIRAPAVWEAVNKELWLSGPAAGRRSRSVRRLKKWWLRAEEAVLPARLRQRRWGRP